MLEKRILAVDLGKKRVGLAVTDPLNIISRRLKTIYFKNPAQLSSELAIVINELNIGTIVFGIPLTLNGNDSQKTTETRELISFIEKKLPADLKIETEDEALTTVEAHETMRKMGLKPSKNKEIVDQVAAQHILNSYLQRNN